MLLRKNGIEIPYPQQDLHIRTVSEKSDSIPASRIPKINILQKSGGIIKRPLPF
jgi:small-conductance mechanosensitive channel